MGWGLKCSIWYFGDGYLPLCINLNPWVFTTQQVNHNPIYLGYGSVTGWNTECDKESDLEMYEKNSLLVGQKVLT